MYHKLRLVGRSGGEGDLEPDVRLDELGDLLEALAEPAAWVLGAVLGSEALRVGALEHLDRIEGLAARAVEDVPDAVLVERLEAVPGIWWKPAHKAEKVWVGIAFAWCMVLFAMMPLWHWKGGQNPSGIRRRTCRGGERVPARLSARAEADGDNFASWAVGILSGVTLPRASTATKFSA